MNKSELSQTERIFLLPGLADGQPAARWSGSPGRGRALSPPGLPSGAEAKAALTEAGYSDISRDHMVYALCALLDESVMNRGTT